MYLNDDYFVCMATEGFDEAVANEMIVLNKKKMLNENRYVAIDFETMSYWRASVCSIGIAVIEGGKIVDTFYTLVCPTTKDESYYCVNVHGIHYNMVRNSPKFSEIWGYIDENYIKGSTLIAHNVGFERSCINACAEEYGTNSDYNYIDTLKMSRKQINGLSSYALDSVCESLNYRLVNHHNALDDAKACANIFIKLNQIDNGE